MNCGGRLAEQRMVVLELRGLRVACLGRRDRRPRRHRRVQPGRVLHDLRARVLEQRDHGAERAAHVVVDGREAQVLGDGDAEGARVGDGRFEIVDAEAVTVARMPTGERPEHQPRVVHRARERAVGDERLPAHRARLARHQPERRLEADEAAERRGNADRAAPVASQRKRTESRGDRGGGSPGRPPGRAIEVPRIARAAVDGRFCDPEVAELRRRRLGVDHRPGGFQPFDRRRRLGGHEVL